MVPCEPNYLVHEFSEGASTIGENKMNFENIIRYLFDDYIIMGLMCVYDYRLTYMYKVKYTCLYHIAQNYMHL